HAEIEAGGGESEGLGYRGTWVVAHGEVRLRRSGIETRHVGEERRLEHFGGLLTVTERPSVDRHRVGRTESEQESQDRPRECGEKARRSRVARGHGGRRDERQTARSSALLDLDLAASLLEIGQTIEDLALPAEQRLDIGAGGLDAQTCFECLQLGLQLFLPDD